MVAAEGRYRKATDSSSDTLGCPTDVRQSQRGAQSLARGAHGQALRFLAQRGTRRLEGGRESAIPNGLAAMVGGSRRRTAGARGLAHMAKRTGA